MGQQVKALCAAGATQAGLLRSRNTRGLLDHHPSPVQFQERALDFNY